MCPPVVRIIFNLYTLASHILQAHDRRACNLCGTNTSGYAINTMNNHHRSSYRRHGGWAMTYIRSSMCIKFSHTNWSGDVCLDGLDVIFLGWHKQARTRGSWLYCQTQAGQCVVEEPGLEFPAPKNFPVLSHDTETCFSPKTCFSILNLGVHHILISELHRQNLSPASVMVHRSGSLCEVFF